ncbi:MAG: CAP domain-containing protein, partial [Isosphaeraceae bacterium]
GWNYADASAVAQGWMNSPGHRQNLLSPLISRFGIAFGPGPYRTLNAR